MHADSSWKTILSDKANFHLDGFVNHQNFRFWGSEKPHVILERPMYLQQVTVCCEFRTWDIT